MWKNGRILYTCRVCRLPCATAEGLLVIDHCCALLEELETLLKFIFFNLLLLTKILVLFNLETSL